MYRTMMLWGLVGCSEVHSSADAPFEVRSIRSALWSVGESDDASSGEALLVLSSASLDCDRIAGATLPVAIDRIVEEGTGLLFYLSQWEDEEKAIGEWTGAWTEDGAGVPSGSGEDWFGGRSLYYGAFDGGLFYELGYDGENAWLDLDKVDAKKAVGSFRSDWWRGTVHAETCAGWDASTPTSTTPTTPPTYSF